METIFKVYIYIPEKHLMEQLHRERKMCSGLLSSPSITKQNHIRGLLELKNKKQN